MVDAIVKFFAKNLAVLLGVNVGVWGFAVPFLISAPNTPLVLVGLVVTLLTLFFSIEAVRYILRTEKPEVPPTSGTGSAGGGVKSDRTNVNKK